jgi:hypothetical protein
MFMVKLPLNAVPYSRSMRVMPADSTLIETMRVWSVRVDGGMLTSIQIWPAGFTLPVPAQEAVYISAPSVGAPAAATNPLYELGFGSPVELVMAGPLVTAEANVVAVEPSSIGQ